MSALLAYAAEHVSPLTVAWLATIAAVVLWAGLTLGWQAVARRRARR